MKQVTGEFEFVEDGGSWVLRHPGAAITIAVALLGAVNFMSSMYIDRQQQPKWDEIKAAINDLRMDTRKDSRDLSTYQLESDRHKNLFFSNIAESANIKMPERPKELDRAEERVREIQERVN